MPNVNDLNEFISPEDVIDGDIITFVDPGEIKKVDFSPKKDGSNERLVLQITIELPDGKEKRMTMNKTSQRAIAAKYSPNSEQWVGKKAKIVLVRQNVGGNLKPVIYLEPYEE